MEMYSADRSPSSSFSSSFLICLFLTLSFTFFIFLLAAVDCVPCYLSIVIAGWGFEPKVDAIDRCGLFCFLTSNLDTEFAIAKTLLPSLDSGSVCSTHVSLCVKRVCSKRMFLWMSNQTLSFKSSSYLLHHPEHCTVCYSQDTVA